MLTDILFLCGSDSTTSSRPKTADQTAKRSPYRCRSRKKLAQARYNDRTY